MTIGVEGLAVQRTLRRMPKSTKAGTKAQRKAGCVGRPGRILPVHSRTSSRVMNQAARGARRTTRGLKRQAARRWPWSN